MSSPSKAGRKTAAFGRSSQIPPSLGQFCLEFWNEVSQRTQTVFSVLDAALTSDEFKERVWAVELLLKKLSPDKQLMQELHALLLDELEGASDAELVGASLKKEGKPLSPKATEEDILAELDLLFRRSGGGEL